MPTHSFSPVSVSFEKLFGGPEWHGWNVNRLVPSLSLLSVELLQVPLPIIVAEVAGDEERAFPHDKKFVNGRHLARSMQDGRLSAFFDCENAAEGFWKSDDRSRSLIALTEMI